MPLSDAEVGARAVAIANSVEMVLDGEDYAAALMAIGRSALDAKRPNLESLMQQLRQIAAATMRQHQHEQARAH